MLKSFCNFVRCTFCRRKYCQTKYHIGKRFYYSHFGFVRATCPKNNKKALTMEELREEALNKSED